MNRLEKENKELRNEVEDLNGQIERLHADMQKMKDSHTKEMNRANEQLQQEVASLKRILDKAYQWFPSFKRFLNMERECLQYGFNEEQTEKLLHGHTIKYRGRLHSNEYRRNVLTDNVSAQVIRDENRNLFLHINQMPIAQWFREQFGLSEKILKGRVLGIKPIPFLIISMRFSYFLSFLIEISKKFRIFAHGFRTCTFSKDILLNRLSITTEK